MRAQFKQEYLTRAMVDISVFQLPCMPFISNIWFVWRHEKNENGKRTFLVSFWYVSGSNFIFLGPNINNAVNSIHT